MNRKKAIYSIFLIGGGVAATYSGYRLFEINKTPDINYLESHELLIAELAEVIIPRTDSPGAKDASVHKAIIQMVKHVSNRKEQNNFIDGLKAVEEYSKDNYKLNFASLTKKQQEDVVVFFQKKGKNLNGVFGKVKNKLLGRSFFYILKDFTTIGFCTSEIGATKALAYDYIPGKYIPCMPVMNNQRSWATK